MEIFSKYHNNHGDKNSDNDNVNNTHASGHISTWVHGKMLHYFPFHGATISSRTAPPHYQGFTITLRHTTLGRLLWTSYWPEAETLPDYTQHSQDKNIPATSSIRTRNPSKRADAMPHLTQRSHWDRRQYILECKIKYIINKLST